MPKPILRRVVPGGRARSGGAVPTEKVKRSAKFRKRARFILQALPVLLVCFLAHREAHATLSDLVKQYHEDNVEDLAIRLVPSAKREARNTVHSKLILPVEKRTLIFEDVINGTASVSTRLVGSFEIPKARRDYLLLEKFAKSDAWGYSWILVNGRSGKMARLRGEPVLSPGGKYYASAYLKELEPSTLTGVNVIGADEYVEQHREDVSDSDGWAGDSLQVIWASSTSFMVLEPIRLYDDNQFVENGIWLGIFCELDGAKWKCSHSPSNLGSNLPKSQPGHDRDK